MKRNILCTLAVMAACAILVACGKTDDQISPITPESNAAAPNVAATRGGISSRLPMGVATIYKIPGMGFSFYLLPRQTYQTRRVVLLLCSL